MGPDEAEIVRRWQQGEALAFEALVRRWQQPVARLLGRLVGRGELVQDLCQEVFLRVYRAQASYQENGAFTSWLYRIALNVARDACRKRRHEPVSLEGQEPPESLISADVVCQQREAALIVNQALAELPEPLRVVLVLRHYEDMSFEQIALLTATPASTVKSRFAAAVTRLRVRLRGLGWGPEETLS